MRVSKLEKSYLFFWSKTEMDRRKLRMKELQTLKTVMVQFLSSVFPVFKAPIFKQLLPIETFFT